MRELLGEKHPYTPPKPKKKKAPPSAQRVLQWDEIKKPMQEAARMVQAVTSGKSVYQNDPVNHPAHYKVGGIETIDFIEAKGLSYNLGNVIKYVTRAGYKGDPKQDLEKARWYLTREIEAL
jgi:hypothetical protein